MADLEQIAEKAHAYRPERRYQSFNEMLEDLNPSEPKRDFKEVLAAGGSGIVYYLERGYRRISVAGDEIVDYVSEHKTGVKKVLGGAAVIGGAAAGLHYFGSEIREAVYTAWHYAKDYLVVGGCGFFIGGLFQPILKILSNDPNLHEDLDWGGFKYYLLVGGIGGAVGAAACLGLYNAFNGQKQLQELTFDVNPVFGYMLPTIIGGAAGGAVLPRVVASLSDNSEE